MAIWVDADSCPVVIRDILFRAAERAQLAMTFVANKPLRLPVSRWLRSVQVGAGFDAADRYIVERLQPDELVVTGDVPLAALVIGSVTSPRRCAVAAWSAAGRARWMRVTRRALRMRWTRGSRGDRSAVTLQRCLR